MRNSKAKRIRRIAKRLAETTETTYVVGKDPVYNLGNKVYIKNSGTVVRPGGVIEPGVPTVMKANCLKFITKKMRKGYAGTLGL